MKKRTKKGIIAFIIIMVGVFAMGASEAQLEPTEGEMDPPLQHYQIEILFFEQTASSETNEQLAQATDTLDLTQALALEESGFSLAENKKLLQQASALQANQDYRVIYHTAWQQPLEAKKEAKKEAQKKIYFKKGEEIEATVLALQKKNNKIQLKGDFLFKKQHEGLSSEVFRLTQTLFIKENALHYFDHPKFGVLLIVFPVDEALEGRS